MKPSSHLLRSLRIFPPLLRWGLPNVFGGKVRELQSKASGCSLSPVIHHRIEIRQDIGGAFEVGGDDLSEVDGMVTRFHLAYYPAFEVGEGFREEWGARLSCGVWGAAEGAVLGLEGLGEPAGQVFLIGVEEVQGEDAAGFDQVVRVLVLADGDDYLLRLEGDLRDPAGGEPVASPSDPTTPVI